MANFRTVDDIKEDVLFRGSEPTDGTSDFDSRIIPLLNRAYRVIWTGGQEFDPDINEKWLWLLATQRAVITLEPANSVGSAAVTNDSNSVTLSNTPSSAHAPGWYFKVDDHSDIFEIQAHAVPADPLTLDSPYTGNTASAASFKVFKTEYSLATDVLYVVGPMRVYRDSRERVHGMDEISMEREWPLRTITRGVPRNFAQIGDNQVRFSHYGGATAGDKIRVDYQYLRKAADLASGSDEPLIPLQHRSVLANLTLFYLYQDKSDDRAEGMGLQAREGLRAMAKDNRYRLSIMTGELGRIYPRPNRRRDLAPLRTESGVIIG